MGEASNPGPRAPPPPTDQSPQHAAPQHLVDAALQLLQALQLLTSPMSHSPVILPTQDTLPTTARSTIPRRRRQKRRKPGPVGEGRQPSTQRPPHRTGQQIASVSTPLGIPSSHGSVARNTQQATHTVWVTPAASHDRPQGKIRSPVSGPAQQRTPAPQSSHDPQPCHYGS